MSNRPTTLLKDGTLYWVLSVYNSDGELVDADSTPTVSVRKNGSATAESVTVTKRSSTTGLYDCSLNPSLEAEGDTFHLEEELDISSVTYNNTWSVVVTEAMITSPEVSTAVWDVPTSSYLGAGTFGLRFSALNTTTPDNVSITAIKSVTDQMVFTIANELDCNAVSGGGGGDATLANQQTILSDLAGLNDFDPNNDTVANVSLVSTCTTNTDMRGTDGANTVVPDNTGISNAIAGLNDFDPATDTVANVSNVATTATNTDMRGTDNASTFDPVFDVVANVTLVATTTTNTDMRGTDNASTFDASTDAVTTQNQSDVTDIKAVTDKLDTALVLDGSVYQYTVNALENAPSGGGGGGSATLAKQNEILADIASLNDFDPASDVVASVTLVGTTTTNTDMRGTDNANTVVPDNAGILAGINALNDFDPTSDVVANVTNVATCVSNTDMRGTDGANTIAPDNAGITANGVAIAALNDTTPQEFWDALTSATYANGSFGESILISQTGGREVIVSSHHVAADVHAFQPNAIDAQAIDAGAVTKLQTGLVTIGDTFTHTNQAGDTMQVTIN